MPIVVGVKFDNTPKVYWFAANGLEYTKDCSVVVETTRGVEMGKVKILPTELPDEKVVGTLRGVLRLADKKDLARQAEFEAKKAEIMKTANEKIAAHKLKMKLVDAQNTVDDSKLVLFFTADSRVDFRELVRDLAGTFHTRIELRQIGTRDECRMLGGFGPCGRTCCCASGCDFAKVNIKMAKNQNLSLNPSKISGLCGRLMCCLSYENAHYTETNKLMPKVGSTVRVKTEDGENTGVVTAINQIKLTVGVKTEVKDGTFEVKDYPLAQIVRLDGSSAADDIAVEADEVTDGDIPLD